MRIKSFGPRPFLRDRAQELDDLRFDRIGIRRASPVIGAEIRGVDLAKPIDDETFSEIRKAYVEFKVIFFRDQDITTDQHVEFAEHFGKLEEHPFLPAKDGYDEIIRFEKSDAVAGVENI